LTRVRVVFVDPLKFKTITKRDITYVIAHETYVYSIYDNHIYNILALVFRWSFRSMYTYFLQTLQHIYQLSI